MTGLHFNISMLFSASNNTCYRQQGALFSYLLNIFCTFISFYVIFKFRKFLCLLNQLIRVYDFVLFFA